MQSVDQQRFIDDQKSSSEGQCTSLLMLFYTIISYFSVFHTVVLPLIPEAENGYISISQTEGSCNC